MDKPTAAARPAGFAIPSELLSSFKTEVRFIPTIGPHYGYIIFDKGMLKNILLSNDAKAREALATQLDKLEHAGGQLVIMGG